MTSEELTPIDFESLLRTLRELLPSPVGQEECLDGSQVLVGGDPGEVILRIGGSKISVSVFSMQWVGPSHPVFRPKQIASLNWKSLPSSRTIELLQYLIEAASELRRANYVKCDRCQEYKPPEWMHNDNSCQSCAEDHLGIVH